MLSLTDSAVPGNSADRVNRRESAGTGPTTRYVPPAVGPARAPADARVEIPLQGETGTNRDLPALFERGSARVRVRSAPGWPGSRPPLRLLCQVNGQPAREATCRPNDRVLLCGIDFQYHSGDR